MKKATKLMLLDKLHYGFVLTCVGVTVFTTAQLFAYVGKFYTVSKPQQEETRRLEFEKLLAEGRDTAEELKDKAPTTSA